MSDHSPLQLDVWPNPGSGRKPLPALAALLAEAKTDGVAAALVTWDGSPEAAKIMAKKRHDLKAALRTLGFAVKALEGGYHFDDDSAAAKIDAIAKATQLLTAEGELLERLFSR